MRRSLGKGLSQLIAEQFDAPPAEAPLDAIVPNARQPRTHFDEEALRELAESIREYGVLQPLVVRPLSEGKYELIAGERRLRAARLAGLETVPILLRSAGSQTSLEIALVENIQREDINPMECARAYRRLMDEFAMTQEEVADRVGKSRTAVANTVRLVRLPQKIQEGLEEGRITEGHARALLAFPRDEQKLAVYESIVEKGLTVREVEKAAKPKPAPTPRPVVRLRSDTHVLEEALRERLGAPVRIGGGRITVEYFDEEDLARLLETLGVRL